MWCWRPLGPPRSCLKVTRATPVRTGNYVVYGGLNTGASACRGVPSTPSSFCALFLWSLLHSFLNDFFYGLKYWNLYFNLTYVTLLPYPHFMLGIEAWSLLMQILPRIQSTCKLWKVYAKYILICHLPQIQSHITRPLKSLWNWLLLKTLIFPISSALSQKGVWVMPGNAPDCTWKLILWCSKDQPYAMSGIEPGSTVCKAFALSSVLSLLYYLFNPFCIFIGKFLYWFQRLS